MTRDPDATDPLSSATHPNKPGLSPEENGASSGSSDSIDIERQIEGLPQPYGDAVRLRLVAHWTVEQIAEYLNRTPKQIATLLLTGVQMLSGDHQTAKADPSAEELSEITKTEYSTSSDALVELLRRQDRGEVIDAEESSKHGETIVNFLQVAALIDQTDFAAGDTFTGSFESKGVRTKPHSDTVTDFPSELASPRAFGDYDLLNAIGRGGMGVVYKARQRKLNRIVALKMIRGGELADKEDIARFYIEAEAAGKLRHPNIVGVHEVGEINGQHFLSMDYVEGHSLRDESREQALETRRAAELCKVIAEAIQVAHAHGIVHRDLKPSNIMVDNNGSPLILDFGLAKRLEDDSGVTYTGQVLGTPSYMAPEQAAGRKETGPLADVYAVGAVLFETLTGRAPFRGSTASETIQQVMQREPVSPRLLNPAVPRDLETICIKCLQKSPDQRYASAQELADELGRFLAGEPIHARPISAATRVWRWCKRNPKVASSLAGTAVVTLVALIVVSISLAVTRGALQKERAAREESERSYRQTRGVVDYWFTQLAETSLKHQPGLQKLRRELLERARQHYQTFLKRHQDDPTLRDEIALTHFRIGLITASIADADQALASLEKALEIQQTLRREQPGDLNRLYHLSNTLTEMGRVLAKLHRVDESMQRHFESHDLRQQLVKAQPKNIEYTRKLANSLMNIGITQRVKFDLVGARKTIQQSQSKRQEALAVEPQNRKLQRDLAKGHYNLATIAIDLQQQAYQKHDWQTADAERVAAMAALRDAIKRFEALRDQDATDFNLRVQLATSYNLLADLQRTVWEDSQIAAADLQRQRDDAARREAERLFEQAARMLDEAVQLYDDARPILETLARMNPDVAAYQHTLSSLYSDLGMLQVVNNKPLKGLQAYEPALVVLDALIQADPNSPVYRRDKAQVLRAAASAQAHPQLKQWQEARANLDRAISILESLREEFPRDEDFRQLLEETRAGLEQFEQLRKAGGS